MKKFPLLIIALLAFAFPAQAQDNSAKATLGAGCFWCVELFYENLEGVTDVVSGYAGGSEPDPTYDAVSAGKTTHVEVVQITYDPAKVSYERILEIFWQTHDPVNGKGVAPDFGPHYRPILLYHDDAQKAAIAASMAAEQKKHSRPLATDVRALDRFYIAEEYHQDFVKKNPNHPYVRNVAIPKLKKIDFSE